MIVVTTLLTNRAFATVKEHAMTRGLDPLRQKACAPHSKAQAMKTAYPHQNAPLQKLIELLQCDDCNAWSSSGSFFFLCCAVAPAHHMSLTGIVANLHNPEI